MLLVLVLALDSPPRLPLNCTCRATAAARRNVQRSLLSGVNDQDRCEGIRVNVTEVWLSTVIAHTRFGSLQVGSDLADCSERLSSLRKQAEDCTLA
ncbi:hypothetical protein FIBSPDRAFT_325629 [Athelia psychrophila]|uniref:Secreted protein n=1 Tax=Athelia psychrophila TaxID=1759441 RepID=A0A166Q8R6_9AGAM|nr:hypothetical protein FIBSPDRAFT_325629 [Fibularhizoctonia sp. CBS 109695]